jgi:hypothetical protein
MSLRPRRQFKCIACEPTLLGNPDLIIQLISGRAYPCTTTSACNPEGPIYRTFLTTCAGRRAVGTPMALQVFRRANVARRQTTNDHQTRANTKQARVLALLRRPSGATITTVTRSTGWQPHTVRGVSR